MGELEDEEKKKDKLKERSTLERSNLEEKLCIIVGKKIFNVV